MPPKIVISASRRTDIPAFYMPWFMAALDRGHFDVANPFNGRISRVPSQPDQVHSIVFWSKNFGPFIDQGYGEQLERCQYHLFFNFTINTPHPRLEPGVPPLPERLEQMARLSRQHGPDCIQWRFDPICYFKDHTDKRRNNLKHFKTIANHAANLGIKVCITSFVDIYRKVQRRLNQRNGLDMFDPSLEIKVATVMEMADHLMGLDMQLHLCCEKEVLKALPDHNLIQAAACIPNKHLTALYGPGIALNKDRGQRQAAGCQCGRSKDIGSYRMHPCYHNCLFCYANPSKNQPNT